MKDIKDILSKKDIFKNEIIGNIKFNEESDKLILINNEENYIIKYFEKILFENNDSNNSSLIDDNNNSIEGIEDEENEIENENNIKPKKSNINGQEGKW